MRETIQVGEDVQIYDLALLLGEATKASAGSPGYLTIVSPWISNVAYYLGSSGLTIGIPTIAFGRSDVVRLLDVIKYLGEDPRSKVRLAALKPSLEKYSNDAPQQIWELRFLLEASEHGAKIYFYSSEGDVRKIMHPKFLLTSLGIVFGSFNLHKSFSTPHGSTGPGTAAIGASEQLRKFLPIPTVAFDGSKYYFDYDRPHSIGKLGEFYGVIPNVLRAYAWIMTMGAEGLEEASEVAVINNNYLIKKLLKVRGVTLPWYESHPFRLQEARFSLQKLEEDTGVGVADVNRRIVDYGLQDMETSHEPWIIPEPFTPEPPETTPREDLDRFAEVLDAISHEAYTSPETVKTAPHKASISKIDRAPSRDPERWAMTWRAYLRKASER